MTFSIVALDADSGEIGAAVQTCWPGVGASVPWVEPGVGGVVTQAFTNVDHGPNGLAQLRERRAAPVVLRELLAADPERDVRQIGVVDAAGRSAAHTGTRCVAEAGQASAADVTVQGNMLERHDAPLLMLDAYQAATGDLADRLMAALAAGDRAGGDIRGRRSAALVVAPGTPQAAPWARRFDLRIDQSEQPLEELARLLCVARAYAALDTAIEASEAGELETALASTAVAHRLAPADAQVSFWHAMVLSASGKAAEARPVLEEALRSEPRLRDFGRRFVEAGHGAHLRAALLEVPRPTRPTHPPASDRT